MNDEGALGRPRFFLPFPHLAHALVEIFRRLAGRPGRRTGLNVARELVAKEEQRRERNRKKAERGEAASGDDVNSDVNVDEELERPDDD